MKVSFQMDGGVLNSHLELSRLDTKDRPSLHGVVAFRSVNSLMDVVSTNGRVMFWTQMDAPKGEGGGYVKFDTIPVLFAVNKIPVGRGMREVALTLDTDKKECDVFNFFTEGRTIERFSTCTYPNWSTVTEDKGRLCSSRRIFLPEHLKLVYRYLDDEQAYLSPEGVVPERWTSRSSSEFKRTAIVMPCVPFSGLKDNALSNRIVNLLDEASEKWSGGKDEEGLVKNLLAMLKEYDEVDSFKVERIAGQMFPTDEEQKGESDAE